MKFKKSLVFFIIILLTNVGCAMGLEQKNDENTNFNGSNVITEEKALMLAKQYTLNEADNLYNLHKMRLISSKDSHYSAIPKELFEVDWIFIVPTKLKVRILQGLKWGIVYVDRKTGEVRPGGMGPA